MNKTIEIVIDGFKYPDSSIIEQQLLADIITCPSLLYEAKRIVNGSMFVDDFCRDLWEKLCKMEDGHKHIDMSTVAQLVDRDTFFRIIIPKMNEESGSGLAVHTHSTMLLDIELRRRIYKFSVNALKLSAADAPKTDELMNLPERFAEEIRSGLNQLSEGVHVSEMFNELADHITKIQNGEVKRIKTGFPSLDRVLYGGFDEGEIVVLAAGTSVGKTAIALQMARSADSLGFPVKFLSLEMTPKQMAQRLLSATEYVNTFQLATGQLDWNYYESAVKCYDKTNLYFDFCPGASIEQIETSIILACKENHCKMVVLDYLQLVQYRDPKLSGWQILGYITKRLKSIAVRCRIPILILSQITLDSEESPSVKHLRGSKEIGNDADIVLMAERRNDSKLNLWIRKNRQGCTNDGIILQPNPTYSGFTEVGVN